VAYALSLNPDHKGLDAFLSQLELATGLKRPEIQRVPTTRYRLEQMMAKATVALDEGRYQEVIDLSRQILQEDPNNLTAWENLGTSYFAIGDYPHSLEAWEKALATEKSPAQRSLLASYIK